MSVPDDVPDDMTGAPLPDDRAADRLLGGRAVDGHDDLAAFVAGLGALRADPPVPRGELAALLADGFEPTAGAPGDAPTWPPRRIGSWGRPAARLAGLSLAAKVLLGSGVAVAGVTSAAGAGVLPGPVQNGVADVVRTVTPFELPTSQPAPTASREDDDAPAPVATRPEVVVPRTAPEPAEAPATKPTPTTTPKTTPTTTPVPSLLPSPTATPTPTPSPGTTGLPTPDATGSPPPPPSPSATPSSEPEPTVDPAEAASTPRGDDEPRPSRGPGGGGQQPTDPSSTG